jgi:hypothetical protein
MIEQYFPIANLAKNIQKTQQKSPFDSHITKEYIENRPVIIQPITKPPEKIYLTNWFFRSIVTKG